MRAFAGTLHVSGKTTTVTRMCVYVDRTHPGSSYGDLSLDPKYGHKTCIVGKQGAAGNSSVVTWNATIATPSQPVGAKGFGTTAHFVDLAKVGPFTVRGYCSAPDNVEAVTDVLSAQDGSSYAWGDNFYSGNFNNGENEPASPYASGSSQNPDFVNEYDNGDFSASTADQKTAFTGFANNGVYINGPDGPACSFTGYLVLENPAP